MNKVKAAFGDNFDEIQAAFVAQAHRIAEKLAYAAIDTDKAEVKVQIIVYCNRGSLSLLTCATYY